MMFVKEFIVRLQDGKNRIEYRDVFMSRNKERIRGRFFLIHFEMEEG